ncbi:hypothetical protein Q7C_2467 [Methylophaga frappieri]|uniref:Uncharacterized protein n=1 Tax=Methylophaga frappieri (strain ATCC BAA-2434 / DSM 25690 / JAM7) TaxID=754477 RepID=I1YKZ9_METFJ|nr:hypothetical protein Q7C_2467 [Methylophaga frappieri]
MDLLSARFVDDQKGAQRSLKIQSLSKTQKKGHRWGGLK